MHLSQVSVFEFCFLRSHFSASGQSLGAASGDVAAKLLSVSSGPVNDLQGTPAIEKLRNYFRSIQRTVQYRYLASKSRTAKIEIFFA